MFSTCSLRRDGPKLPRAWLLVQKLYIAPQGENVLNQGHRFFVCAQTKKHPRNGFDSKNCN